MTEGLEARRQGNVRNTWKANYPAIVARSRATHVLSWKVSPGMICSPYCMFLVVSGMVQRTCEMKIYPCIACRNSLFKKPCESSIVWAPGFGPSNVHIPAAILLLLAFYLPSNWKMRCINLSTGGQSGTEFRTYSEPSHLSYYTRHVS